MHPVQSGMRSARLEQDDLYQAAECLTLVGISESAAAQTKKTWPVVVAGGVLIDQPWNIMSIARRDWAVIGHSI